ncbi:MAG TPA: hypothetical protein VHS96_11795, partial [Bacteroidia bacterium]|nr:hypothetical protein [Bacteroidia bacterium]
RGFFTSNSAMEFNSKWFRENLEGALIGYVFNYRRFPNGDFGSLDEVELENERYQGSIDYWESGHLGIHLWDIQKEEDAMNVMLAPNQPSDKEAAITTLVQLLMKCG